MLEPLGGDEAEFAAAALDQRVGAHRGRVGDRVRRAQRCLEIQPRALGRHPRGVHETDLQVVVRGIGFAAMNLARFHHDDIGEGAADVDADPDAHPDLRVERPCVPRPWRRFLFEALLRAERFGAGAVPCLALSWSISS